MIEMKEIKSVLEKHKNILLMKEKDKIIKMI